MTRFGTEAEEDARQPWSPAETLADGMVAAFCLMVLNAFALDLLGVSLTPWPPVIMTVAEAVLILGLIRPRLSRPLLSGQFVGWAVTVVGVWLVFVVPSLPSFYPPTGGIDAVLHYLETNYIFENRALPHDFYRLSPYLGEMASFPPGAAMFVALVAQLLALPPLVVMHPFAALVRGLAAGYVFLITDRLLPDGRGRALAALAGPLFLFVPATYFVGALVKELYYFGTVLAELLALAILAHVTDFACCARRRSLAYFVLLTLGLALGYTPWLGIPSISVAIALLVQDRAWWRRAVDMLLVLLPLGCLLAVFLPGRAAAGVDVLQYEGGIVKPSVTVLGWPLLLSGAIGLAVAVRSRRRYWMALVVLAVCLAQLVAFYVAAEVLHLSARYHYFKNVYLLIHPLAILGALGLVAVTRSALGQGRTFLAQAATTAIVLLLAVASLIVGPSVWSGPVLTPDLVNVANWAKTHVERDQIGYRVTHAMAAYWLHCGILGNPRADFRAENWLELPRMTLAEWLEAGTWPTYFLVQDMRELPTGRYEVLYRKGDTALLATSPRALPSQPAIAHPLSVTVGDLMVVDGYDAATRVIVPGAPLDLTIYWHAIRWPHHYTGVKMYVHLLDDQNRMWGQVDRKPIEDKPGLVRWPLGVMHTERFAIPVPADAPPGRYAVEVGAYPVLTTRNLPLTEAGGRPLERLLIGPFKIPLPPTGERPQRELNRTFGARIVLWGFDLSAREVRSGEMLVVRLYWQTVKDMDEDYTVFVHLAGEDGRPLAQCDSQPRGGSYPTSIWESGEVIADDCALAVPPAIAPGTYHLLVGLYHWPSLERLAADGGGSSVNLDRVTVLPASGR